MEIEMMTQKQREEAAEVARMARENNHVEIEVG